MDKCTVLMSTYNGERYVKEQLDSILNQTGILIKLIVRDDGSKDMTKQILRNYADKNPSTIKLIEGENCGIHESFAKLIESCPESEYIAFADQDDIWDVDKLSIAINLMKKESYDFYSCAARLVDENNNLLNISTSNKKKYDHYMKSDGKILTPGAQGCTIVLNSNAFELIKRHYPHYYGHDTWISVVCYYLSSSYYDDREHMNYRQHNNSWTGNRKNRFKQKCKEFRFFWKGMERYRQLSEDLVKVHNDALSERDIKILNVLKKKKKSFKDRIFLLKLREFTKYGTWQNLLFKFCIIIGRV